MNNKEFRKNCATIYGNQHGWQAWLSQEIEVTDRTVRRWARGDTPVPRWVIRELGRMEPRDTTTPPR